MASLLGKLKGSSVPVSPALGSSPNRKATAHTPSTPLERWLAESRPSKYVGPDKYFGMHNPSNTCYCNSVVQCLYFSESFREQVVNFPRRVPRNSTVENGLNATHSPNEASRDIPKSPMSDISPTQKPIDQPAESNPSKKAPAATPSSSNNQAENKESFEYQKKMAMLAGPHLRLEQGFNHTYGMPESLFTSLKDIFEAIIASDSRTGIVTPAKFLEILRRNHETFKSHVHQDAHEFLNILLNEVVEQVETYSKSQKETAAAMTGLGLSSLTLPAQDKTQNVNSSSSWVHELFEGTLTSETRCLTCENISQQNEAFLDLSVDLDEHSSVTSCLSKFSEEEMLCERNKFHCDNCSGLQEAEKRMKIKRLPRILALHLKRFKYIEEIGTLRKLFHRVVYPFHLRLLNTTDDAEDPDRLYELYAVVVHLGSTPFHGHYVSIIKSKDRGWLLFDDELVLPVDKEYVRNFFGGDPRNPACAYVLFYQETTIEAVQREQETESVPSGSPVAESGGGIGVLSETVSGDDDPLSPTLQAQPLPTSPAEEPGLLVNLSQVTSAPAASASPIQPNGTNNIGRVPEKVPWEEGDPALHSSARNGPAAKSGHFNRLKHSSLNLRSKPKLWSAKDKTADESLDHATRDPEDLQREVTAPAAIVPEKAKTKGGLFGRGKKK